MQIYETADPMAIMWSLFKDLGIPVYKDINEVTDDVNIYVLIRTDINNNGRIYGDGHAHIRKSICDINLVSKNRTALSSGDFAVNCSKIAAILDGAGLTYTGHDLGYNDSLKAIEYNWSVNILYG